MTSLMNYRRFLLATVLTLVGVSGCAERAEIEWANYRKDPSLKPTRSVRFQGYGSGAFGSGMPYGSGAYGSGMPYGSGAFGSGMPYGSGQFNPGQYGSGMPYGSGFNPAAYGSGMPNQTPYGTGN